MDMAIVNKLKVMSREEVGKMQVKELAPVDAIWNLIEYIRELETQYVPKTEVPGIANKPAIPGLEG